MIVGLDCAEPSLVLERWRDELPTISGLMERGAYGRLTSVIPPITVPAWSLSPDSNQIARATCTPLPFPAAREAAHNQLIGMGPHRNRSPFLCRGAFFRSGTDDLVGRASFRGSITY